MSRQAREWPMTYKDHSSMEGTVCFYCYHFGDTTDHYPPLALQHLFWNKGMKTGLRIRACWTCNWTLGDSVQKTLAERRAAATAPIETKRIPPRFKTRAERDAYKRAERMMLRIARRGRMPEDRMNADEMMNELKGEDDGSNER